MLEAKLSALFMTAALLAWVAYRERETIISFFRRAKEEYVDENLMRLGIDAGAYNAVTFGMAAAGAVIGLLFLENIVAAGLFAVFAFLFRRQSLELKKIERKSLIDQQAEVALQMIASLYETTGDMIKAFEGASECVPSPMADELKRVVAEYRAGAPLGDAMLDFAERSGNKDIDIFVRGVNLSEKYGTQTSEVVHDVAELIRDRITLRDELKNELRGQKLTVNVFLMLIPIVGTGLFLFSPEARHTMTSTMGGKVIVNILICIEYFAWYFMSRQGLVEEL